MPGYIKDIRGIKVNISQNNCCHETMDSLTCDMCHKKRESVVVLYSKSNSKDIRFACGNDGECLKRAISEMFAIYDDDYVFSCKITDINFTTKKETKKRVRAEMTLKLRYQIMKRDNFQCVMCGRRPPNVELCVDHIKPVCKGGLSIESNLRTLCKDCNSGKGGE